MLIIMADLLSISVGTLFTSAIVPGLLLASLYLIFVISWASVKPDVAPKLPPELLFVPSKEMAPLLFRGFFPPVILIGMIKGSILLGWATPSEAGAVGCFGAMLIAFFKGTLKWDIIKGVCQSSGLTIAMIFFIVMSATCFAYVFRSLGGDDVVEELILEAGFGSWGLLFLIMSIVFFLGFFLDWVEITLIVLPVFAPLVVGLNFEGHVPEAMKVYWFTGLVAINLQTSFLTPPFGFALFYMKCIAPKEVDIKNIYLGIIPFVLIQCSGVIMVLFWPNIALWLPGLVYAN